MSASAVEGGVMGAHVRLRVSLAAAAVVLCVVVTALIDPDALPTVLDTIGAALLPYIGYLLFIRTWAGSVAVGLALGGLFVWVQAQASRDWATGFHSLWFVGLMFWAPILVAASILIELSVQWVIRRQRPPRTGDSS